MKQACKPVNKTISHVAVRQVRGESVHNGLGQISGSGKHTSTKNTINKNGMSNLPSTAKRQCHLPYSNLRDRRSKVAFA
jgi:hypothetical protein